MRWQAQHVSATFLCQAYCRKAGIDKNFLDEQPLQGLSEAKTYGLIWIQNELVSIKESLIRLQGLVSDATGLVLRTSADRLAKLAILQELRPFATVSDLLPSRGSLFVVYR